MSRVLHTVIASGQTVGPDVDLRAGQLGLIGVPTIDSANLYVRGGFNTTSASFLRMQDANGDILFPTATGSRMVAWPLGTLTPPYVRLELSAATTVPRTLTILRY
ncbi:MAG: hypothetical protein NUW01_19705 [Gemmatimonadaceae bacterium]|nr:hypothetical protein [Gemmatimonadaceae bacterium]